MLASIQTPALDCWHLEYWSGVFHFEILGKLMQVSYPISQLIDMFCADQDVKENSRHLYMLNLKRFFIWASKCGKDQRLMHRADIIQYKNDMMNTHEVTTTESYLVPVKKFYAWLSEKGWHANVASGIKTPRRSRQYKKKALQFDQVAQLLSIIDTETLRGKRDFAIVNLMLRNGLRCTEVTRLSVGDIVENENQIGALVHGKSRNEKEWVPITSKVREPLHDYLLSRGNLQDEQPLFASLAYNNRAGRMVPGSISSIVKTYLNKIGINDKNITAHSLRHTTAQMLLRAGAELYEVQKFLRHTSSKITEIYLQSMNDELIHRNNPGKKLDEMF